MTIFFRSIIFNFGFYFVTFLLMIVFAPALFLDRRALPRCGRIWAMFLRWWLRVTVEILVEVRGEPPKDACLIAAKHQSAWETIEFLNLLPDTCFILKKELTRIPLFGWYIIRNSQIVIDRSGGVGALKHMAFAAKTAVSENRQIVVFPQGTRVAPDVNKEYQPGVGFLYKTMQVKVVPVALNSGLFWGRNKFLKRPGKIVIEFLPPIEEGLSARAFVKKLSSVMEQASDRLIREARQNIEGARQ